MKEFDGYRMTGASEDETDIILQLLALGIDLYVNDCGMVFDGSGKYILDYVNVEFGEGIFC